jgi:plastocyanin
LISLSETSGDEENSKQKRKSLLPPSPAQLAGRKAPEAMQQQPPREGGASVGKPQQQPPLGEYSQSRPAAPSARLPPSPSQLRGESVSTSASPQPQSPPSRPTQPTPPTAPAQEEQQQPPSPLTSGPTGAKLPPSPNQLRPGQKVAPTTQKTTGGQPASTQPPVAAAVPSPQPSVVVQQELQKPGGGKLPPSPAQLKPQVPSQLLAPQPPKAETPPSAQPSRQIQPSSQSTTAQKAGGPTLPPSPGQLKSKTQPSPTQRSTQLPPIREAQPPQPPRVAAPAVAGQSMAKPAVPPSTAPRPLVKRPGPSAPVQATPKMHRMGPALIVIVLLVAAVLGYYQMVYYPAANAGSTFAPIIPSKTNSTVVIAAGSASGTLSQTFTPSSITVVIGQNASVVWINRDSAAHTVTSSGSSNDVRWDTLANRTNNINPAGAAGSTFNYTFSVPGTYNYFCSYHPFMHGTVIVVKGTTSVGSIPQRLSASGKEQGQQYFFLTQIGRSDSSFAFAIILATLIGSGMAPCSVNRFRIDGTEYSRIPDDLTNTS